MKSSNKLIILILLFFAINSASAQLTNKINESLQKEILNEADDWIDDMPDGQQDRMSDAILHAIRGFNSEILYYRNDSNIPKSDSKVEVKKLSGGKNGEINMWLYNPISSTTYEPLPLLIYFHGGLWSFGSLSSSDKFCKALVKSGKLKIISVDYPLSPENPYPAALIKCVSAIEEIYNKAKEFGSSTDLISVGGDDAGGNLALAAVTKIKEESNNKINLKSLVLYYPILNAKVDKSKGAWRKFGKGYGLDSRLLDAGGEAYVGGLINNSKISDVSDPLISPLNLTKSQMQQLPPILIIAAGQDLLIDWEEEFVSNLKSAGNKTTYINFSGAIHGFIDDNNQPTAFQEAANITLQFLTH